MMPVSQSIKLAFAALVISWMQSLLLVSGCTRLEHETWEELVNQLNVAQQIGYIVFCNFEISGPQKCPPPNSPGYEINTFMMDVYCEHWLGDCIIDCPQVDHHFVIASGAVVTMEGLTTRGAKRSSIWVKSQAYFKALSFTFENNGLIPQQGNGASSGGSAVLVDEFAYADLRESRFISNKGRLGGAICNHGEVIVAGGDFRSNEGNLGGAIYNTGSLTVNQVWFAENKALSIPESGGQGGAIYTHSEVHMVGSTFESNFADQQGGAVFSSSGTVVSRFSLWKYNSANAGGSAIFGDNFSGMHNEGCKNTGGSGCNGAENSHRSCHKFSTICAA